MPEITKLFAFLISALTGILSGFGIGGGTLLIILLTFFFSAEQLTAQAINLCYFIPTAGASLLFHGKGGMLDRRAIIWTGCFGVIFSAAGAYISPYIEPRFIQIIFGVILLALGIRELFAEA